MCEQDEVAMGTFNAESMKQENHYQENLYCRSKIVFYMKRKKVMIA